MNIVLPHGRARVKSTVSIQGRDTPRIIYIKDGIPFISYGIGMEKQGGNVM